MTGNLARNRPRFPPARTLEPCLKLHQKNHTVVAAGRRGGSDVVRDAFLAPCPHAGGLFLRALVIRAHETPCSNSKHETLKALELCLTPHLWPVQAAAGALPIPDVPEHGRRGCGGWDCISCMPVLPIHVSASWHVPRTYFAAQHNRSGWCRPQHVRVKESVARHVPGRQGERALEKQARPSDQAQEAGLSQGQGRGACRVHATCTDCPHLSTGA